MKKLNRILTNPGSILGILLPLIVMVVLTVIVYANTFHADFIFDSICYIVEDPAIRIVELTPEDILNAGINGKPRNRLLPNISFGLNYFFDTYHVEGYHLVNMIIHILTGAFIFLFFRKTLLTNCAGNHSGGSWLRSNFQYTACIAAGFAAALWLLHPVQTQAVSYIVQRMTSMAVMFYVLSLLLYVAGRLSWKSKRNRFKAAAWFSGCLIAGVCAIISKQNAGTLPIVILLYEWFFFQNLSVSLSKKQITWILGGLLIFGAVAVWYLGGDPLERILNSYTKRDFTLLERVMTEWRVVIYYISLLFYPHPARLVLDHDYPLSSTVLGPPTTFLSLIAVASLIAVSVYIARKGFRLIGFCILWFFITLAIESSVIGIEIIFEHRLYLASIMPMLLVGIMLAERIKRQWAAILIMGIALILCSTFTWQRNQYWHTPLALLQDNMHKTPNDPRVLNNLGNLLVETGQADTAIPHLKKSIRLQTTSERPNMRLLFPMNNLAIALTEKEKYDDAMGWLRKALKINPDSVVSHINLAKTLLEIGQQDRAIKHFEKALAIDPQSTKALARLGDIYYDQNELDKAMTYFQKLLVIDPGNIAAHLKLGYSYFKRGAIEKAIDYYEKALTLEPGNEEALVNLGNMHIKNGNPAKAVAVFKRAVRLNPANREANFHLAIAHALQDDYEASIRSFKQMLAHRPQDPNIYYNIACMHALNDSPAESADWLKKAVEKGYDNWKHIKTDPDLKNLRESKYYNKNLKSQITSYKQIPNHNDQNSKQQ